MALLTQMSAVTAAANCLLLGWHTVVVLVSIQPPCATRGPYSTGTVTAAVEVRQDGCDALAAVGGNMGSMLHQR